MLGGRRGPYRYFLTLNAIILFAQAVPQFVLIDYVPILSREGPQVVDIDSDVPSETNSPCTKCAAVYPVADCRIGNAEDFRGLWAG